MSDHLPNPETAPELFESVLTRRVMAFVIDMAIIGAATLALLVVGTIVGIATLGVGFLLLPFAVIALVVGYYALTLGSQQRATIGMRSMDLVLTPTRGRPLDGWLAFAHTLVFWVTIWVSWPVSLVIALFTPRRQMVHDLVVGVLMVRRSPMEQHWRSVNADAAAF